MDRQGPAWAPRLGLLPRQKFENKSGKLVGPVLEYWLERAVLNTWWSLTYLLSLISNFLVFVCRDTPSTPLLPQEFMSEDTQRCSIIST